MDLNDDLGKHSFPKWRVKMAQERMGREEFESGMYLIERSRETIFYIEGIMVFCRLIGKT